MRNMKALRTSFTHRLGSEPVPAHRTGISRFGLSLSALAAGLVLACPSAARGAEAGSLNWPQWRGPAVNGVAPQGNPPTTWSETENVKWKVRIPGSGTSTPIIWGNQIFIQTAISTGKKVEPADDKKTGAISVPTAVGQVQTPATRPEGDGQRRPGGGGEKPTEVYQFVLMSIDRATGKLAWQRVVREEVPHEGHHRDHGFASHSPVTDGKLVYSWFGSRGLHCYNLDGELKWEKDFGKFRSANGFGEGSSPALFGNALVINWDHEGEDFIAAFDKESGRELWRQPRNEKTTWTTPLIVQHDGKPQVIVCASQRIRCYDLVSGNQAWECGGLFANVIPTPVSDFGMVFAMSGFRGSALLAIRLDKSGDLTDPDAIAGRYAKSTPYVPSPLLYGENLYFLSGNNAVLSCFEAKTGKPLISEQRLEGPSGFYASPVGAAGRVYLVGRNGTSLVLKNSGGFEVLATNKLDENFDASPAIVGRELFLRGHEYLYCLAEK